MGEDMFKYGKLSLIFIAAFFISCNKDDSSIEFEVVSTVVKGNISDIERNLKISDFEIRLIRFWTCTSVVQSALCTEDVATTTTDAYGNYEIEFDYIKDGKNYGFQKVYSGYPYHTEYLEDYGPIIPGEINTYNIDAWRTVKIKLDLQVRNNNHPHLRINSTVVESGYFNFPQASIYEQNLDTIVYLDSKPNSVMDLNFHYTTGYSNSDYHSKREIVQTTLQDTIEFSYLVDCSTF